MEPDEDLIFLLCLSTQGLMQMPTPMPKMRPKMLRRATWVPEEARRKWDRNGQASLLWMTRFLSAHVQLKERNAVV